MYYRNILLHHFKRWKLLSRWRKGDCHDHWWTCLSEIVLGRQQVFVEIRDHTDIYKSYNMVNSFAISMVQHTRMSFPGKGMRFSDIKFHNLFDLAGRNWKTLSYKQRLRDFRHWSPSVGCIGLLLKTVFV